MYKFQAYRADAEIKKDMDLIAKIILSEKFDIIAMQEIFNKAAMEMILKRLGGNWEGAWAQPNSRSVQAAEGYAFIWNTRRIELAESYTFDGNEKNYGEQEKSPAGFGKKVFQPRIYNQYRIDRASGQKELVRNPFYARFKPKYENFELRIINTHIMYTDGVENEGQDGNDISASLSIRMKRKKEMEVLVKNILARENTRRYGNNLPAYTILMGDYNLNLDRDWTESPYLQEVIEITDRGHKYSFQTVQDQMTTLKHRSRSKPDEPVRGYANNYDHFTYDTDRFMDLHPKAKRIDSVRVYCEDDFEKHRAIVSDHVPISIELNLKEEVEP